MKVTSDIDCIGSKSINLVLDLFKTNDQISGLQSLHRIKPANEFEKTIIDLLTSYLYKSESLSPGSTKFFLNYLTFFKEKNVISKRFHKNDLDLLIESYSNKEVRPLLTEATNLANIKSKFTLSIESPNSEKDVIELTEGNVFSNLTPAFLVKESKFRKPKILCIDGFIENVSEVHHLLHSSAESKDTIILFVRGLSDEVINTLKVNYDRGILNVIPVVVRYDLEGVNLLVDIATIVNDDVISSLKGDLISKIDITRLKRVDIVEFGKNEILIENLSFNSNFFIKSLQKKILEVNDEYSKSMLTKRVQRFGTNRILIKLVEEKNKKHKSLMIDQCFRAIKSAISYGVCEVDGNIHPFSSVKVGEFYAKEFIKSLKSIGSILIED